MSALTPPQSPAVDYPDSDGQPMADNTVQFTWISIVKWELEAQYRDDPDVFVAGDHLIYPVQGNADLRQAPDVYVAFGRPKGDRGSYRVWEEGGTFPQVVFEVWSPNNRAHRMEEKRKFYEAYGAEEYYVLYPEFPAYAEVWQRESGRLVRVELAAEWVSPRLGIRIGVTRGELHVHGPTGRLFRSPDEIAAERDAEQQRADEEKLRADEEKLRADEEKLRADEEKLRADREARQREAERQRAEQEQERAEKLAARLRELGVDPDAV